MTKILISGYYGSQNAGDELILSRLLSDLRSINPALSLEVLSNNPGHTREHHAICAINRYNPASTLLSIARADAVIQGGGGLYQDKTSAISLYYYLFIIFTAKLLFKKVYIYAAGINTLKVINRKVLVFVLGLCDVITLRDIQSKNLLESWGMKRKPLLVTADPALNYPYQVKDISNLPLIVGVVLRHSNSIESNAAKFAEILDGFVGQTSAALLFIPFQKSDIQIALKLTALLKSRLSIAEPGSAEKVFDEVKKCNFMLSMRLHAMIIASLNAIPFLGVSDDEKLARYASSTGQFYYDLRDKGNLNDLGRVLYDSWTNSAASQKHYSNIMLGLVAASKSNRSLLAAFITALRSR